MLRNNSRSAYRRPIDWLLPCLVSAALVGIGAWQQVGFSLEMGQLAFFKNAYDEDTYALFSANYDGVRLDRLISASLLQFFKDWTGGYDLGFILADAFLPAAAFLSCWFLVGHLFRDAAFRTFWALVILFSPDLFSLGSAASSTASLYAFSSFKALFGDMGSVLVPPIETSYLNVLRTFEPQLAYIVGFLFVGLLLRVFLGESRAPHWIDLVSVGVVQCLVLMTYSIVGYPLIALEFYVALILYVTGSRKAAFVLLTYFLISISAVMISASLLLDGQSLVVASRLPSIGTSTVGSVVMCLIIFSLLARRRFADRRLWLALGFSGLPIVLMNQQVITGLMVSSKEWERYINHPLLVIGAAMVFSDIKFIKSSAEPAARRVFSLISVSLVLGILVFAVDGIRNTRGYWISLNEKSLAMTRAIDLISHKLDSEALLVLDETSLAPLIAVRSAREPEFLVDYTNVFLNWIPSSTAADYEVPEVGIHMFEYWRLAAKSPVSVEELLRSEAQSRSGFYSGFFFNICDYWYPCSDNRAVKSDLIQVLIGKVVEAYKTYLSEKTSTPSRNYLLVATEPTPGAFGQHFASVAVASARAGQVTAYVFEQSSR